MPEKPSSASEYSKEQVRLVTATCLYVATILGDYMEQAVIVGGLVPSLLIDQENLPNGADSHAGTMDLDVGLTLAIFDNKRYQAITDRLRSAKFSPDVNEQGNLTSGGKLKTPERLPLIFSYHRAAMMIWEGASRISNRILQP